MAIEARACTPLLKGPSRRQEKAKKDRAEDKVAKAVRAACVERDGPCRLFTEWLVKNEGWAFGAALNSGCSGDSEWAHLKGHRRSHTRGMAPEVRHDTQHTLILCRRHHQAEEAGTLRITALTRKGADGPLKFRRPR